MATGHGDDSWIQASRCRGRVLQAAAILAVPLGPGLDQSKRTAAVRFLSASMGSRSRATARICELAVAGSSLHEPGKMRGTVAAPACRVPVRYRERRSCAAWVAIRSKSDLNLHWAWRMLFPPAMPNAVTFPNQRSGIV